MQTAVQHAPVTRTRKPDDEPTTPLGIRIPESLMKAIDDEIERISPQGFSITRSDMVRVLLGEALAARRKATEKKR